MVAFVPNLPEGNSPQYIGYSKPLTRFDVGEDKTGETTVGAFGNVLKNAVTGADETVKSVINQALYKDVDTKREGYTGDLEEIAGVPQANRVASYQPDLGAGDPSLTQTANVPPAVDNGLSKAANLVNASTGTGKLTPSYYEGRLDLVAKDLRSQYPGYREYIDQKMAEMTGGNPANKYMQEMLTQINQGITNNRTLREKLQSDVLADADKGIPGAKEMFQMVATAPDLTKAGTAVAEWRGRANQLNWQLSQDKARLESSQTDVNGKKLIATQNNSKAFNSIISNGIFTTETAGIPLADIPDFIKNAAGKDHDPVLANQMAMQLNASISALKGQMYSAAKQNGSADVLGGDLTAQIENHPGIKILENARDALKKGDYDLASSSAQFVKAAVDKDAEKLFGDPNNALAKYTRIEGVLGRQGPNASRNMQGIILGALAADPKNPGAGGLSDGLKQYMETTVKGVATGETTLSKAIDEYKQRNIGNPPVGSDGKPLPGADSTKRDRQVYTGTVRAIGDLINSKTIPDEIKRGIFTGTYSPDNMGITNKFDEDKVVNGQLYKGRHGIFTDMTAPSTTDEAWRFGRQNPTVWQNYKQFAENEFRHLYTSDTQFLDSAANGGYKIVFDSDKTEFRAVPDGSSTPTTNFIAGMSAPVVNTRLAGLNSALQTMKRINDKENTNSNAYIMNIMKETAPLDSPVLKAIMSATSGKKADAGHNPELTDFQPESASDKTPLHSVIGKAESNENYDSLFGSNSTAKLTQMTVGEVMAVQKHHLDEGSPSSAAGNYQILLPTLKSLVKEGKVKPTDKFDQDTQDNLATALMERRGLNDFKSGKMSKEQFVNNLAKEWAGLPTTSGQSYYEGDGLNHARVKLPQVIASLGKL